MRALSKNRASELKRSCAHLSELAELGGSNGCCILAAILGYDFADSNCHQLTTRTSEIIRFYAVLKSPKRIRAVHARATHS